MSPFAAGRDRWSCCGLPACFAFTKFNPFANPYELTAVFDDANNLKPNSPVRIAGVEVGKVTKVEAVEEGKGAAKVTMEIEDKGLPIHEDAELKIRPRIFLEGNFFVDLQPGSPSAPELERRRRSRSTRPRRRSSSATCSRRSRRDTREDLQTFLREYSKGARGRGRRGLQRVAPLLGARVPELGDRQRGHARPGARPRHPARAARASSSTFAALAEDEDALKDLVTNLNITAGALAREDVALEASIPALRDTLAGRRSRRSASLNAALPTLRAFARDALPGVRSSDETLEAVAAVHPRRRARWWAADELRAPRARAAQPRSRRSWTSTRRRVPFLEQARALSSCTNEVLVPFVDLRDPEPGRAPRTTTRSRPPGRPRGFVGLSGESRLSDGNNQFFHARRSCRPATSVRPGPPPDGGDTPPPHRPGRPVRDAGAART